MSSIAKQDKQDKTTARRERTPWEKKAGLLSTEAKGGLPDTQKFLTWTSGRSARSHTNNNLLSICLLRGKRRRGPSVCFCGRHGAWRRALSRGRLLKWTTLYCLEIYCQRGEGQRQNRKMKEREHYLKKCCMCLEHVTLVRNKEGEFSQSLC